jgi:hypothetical protein
LSRLSLHLGAKPPARLRAPRFSGGSRFFSEACPAAKGAARLRKEKSAQPENAESGISANAAAKAIREDLT